MGISFTDFLQQMAGSPVLGITVVLTLGVIFVNGWTDAPNAIATCITTRCMTARSAIWMSAVFNFLGVFVMTQINSSVASTISNMVDFGGDTRQALIALCAALFSIVVYSVGASIFGIPTSESHSLIAGLSGAAIAIQNGIGGINMEEWAKVLYGLVLSLLLGFATGWLVCRAVTGICRYMDRRKTNRFFKGAQIFGAAAMSFMHGAQDGQKFIGVLFLGMAFCNGQSNVENMVIPLWLMLLCSVVMGCWHQCGRRKNHQIRGDGHGPLGKIPRFFCRSFRCAVSAVFKSFRDSRFHYPHKNYGHYGCRSGQASFCHQFRCCKRDGSHLGFHVPRLWSH